MSIKRPSNVVPDFTVVVCFPSSSKEYAYLCNFPCVQGDTVIANGTRVEVRRTANFDNRAMKYVQPVPDHSKVLADARRAAIRARLKAIEIEELDRTRWLTLAKKSPEARKLVAELTKLNKEHN